MTPMTSPSSIPPPIANTLWVASCLPEWRRFQGAANAIRETQAGWLAACLRGNQNSQYGQRHSFDTIHSPQEYQRRVPLTSYDDYTDQIARIGAGQPNVLTAAPVRMFELSSGSAAASKLIPYTDALKAEFQRGLAPWIYNLYTHIPDLQRGPAYWSVTPLVEGKRFTSGGIPIGFESDSAYLGPLGKWLVESALAVPDSVKLAPDVDSFRYQTLLHLLRHRDLRLISVWNPTFLTLLLDALKEFWDRLLDDIERGTSAPHSPDPQLGHALRACSPTEPESLWPRLGLLSCWADGPSAPYAARLREIFPHATMQAKGLLATEAFVSFPLVGVEGSVLAIRSHFFEFMDTSGECLLAHQIEKGKTYSVVITTGGGLYRYQLHDIIEVIGHWRQIPCIRFVGKADHISDWFGEKLDERFVAGVFEQVFAAHDLSPAFAMLAPHNSGGFCYQLYIESKAIPTSLAKALDQALRENFHYDYCRKLGQIGPLQITQVTDGAQTYLYACHARGQRLGNIKPGVLQKTSDWAVYFKTSCPDQNQTNYGKIPENRT